MDGRNRSHIWTVKGVDVSGRMAEAKSKKKKTKNNVVRFGLEYVGVEPTASPMLRERSTDELEPLRHI